MQFSHCFIQTTLAETREERHTVVDGFRRCTSSGLRSHRYTSISTHGDRIVHQS